MLNKTERLTPFWGSECRWRTH